MKFVIALLAALLIPALANAANYTATTNAKAETVLTRAAAESGATKDAMVQTIFVDGLKAYQRRQEDTDALNIRLLAETATAGGRSNALAALAATIAVPTITPPGSQTSAVNAKIALQVVGADATDGLALTFTATNLPPGLKIGSDGIIFGTITSSAGSPLSVTVRATKLLGVFAETSFTWTVTP